jgi:hypothetical protein
MARGGYRPGAGRPKGSSIPPKPAGLSALAWLLSVVNDPTADPARKDRCAIAALSFQRRDMPGKRETAEQESKTAAAGTSWEELLSRD